MRLVGHHIGSDVVGIFHQCSCFSLALIDSLASAHSSENTVKIPSFVGFQTPAASPYVPYVTGMT